MPRLFDQTLESQAADTDRGWIQSVVLCCAPMLPKRHISQAKFLSRFSQTMSPFALESKSCDTLPPESAQVPHTEFAGAARIPLFSIFGVWYRQLACTLQMMNVVFAPAGEYANPFSVVTVVGI